MRHLNITPAIIAKKLHRVLPLLLASISLRMTAQPYTFTHFAGTPGGHEDADGQSVRFNTPNGVAVDPTGNIFVADTNNHTIRKITPYGEVTTFAGLGGSPGSTNGTGSAARFNFPDGVASDLAGNIFVADTGNSTIRKITPAGVVTTFAGLAGNTGSADGTGSAALFHFPEAVAVDGAGNVFVADRFNHTLRKITSAAVVTTLAGLAGNPGIADGTGSSARFTTPFGVAVDGAGNVYVADTGNFTIRKVTSLGVVTTLAGLAGSSGSTDGTGSAARFSSPHGVATDGAANVYVADSLNETLRMITPAGVVTTMAGSATNSGTADGIGTLAKFYIPTSVAVDGAGNLYIADSDNFTVRKVTPAGLVTTLAGLAGSSGKADGDAGARRFNSPYGVARDTFGNIYVADTQNHTIRKITPAGLVTTFAGLAGIPGSADGTGGQARFNAPNGITANLDVYVADTGNHTIRKITPAGLVTTLAGLAANPGSPDGTGSAARFNGPDGVAWDNTTGNVFVADTGNHTIRKITPAGVVTTFAGFATSSGSTDGTGAAARFTLPEGVDVDNLGNVFVADSGNHILRKITPAGVVTTFAGLAGASGSTDGTAVNARFNRPTGVTADNSGNLYVADDNNHTIRKLQSNGFTTTLAGLASSSGVIDGEAGSARFNLPYGVALDTSTGMVYVADSANHTLRKVRTTAPAGSVTTVAGTADTAGDANGAGGGARFFFPYGIAVDGAGNCYVADTNSHTIRKITPAGWTTTLAGLPGSFGSANGTGSAARFQYPVGTATDGAGNVYVADNYNHIIRKITPAGVVTTLAGLAGTPGSANGTGAAARFNFPSGVTTDSASNVFVADTNNQLIRKITPAGVVTTFAGLALTTGSADGTGGAARFNFPRTLATDSSNNIYVTDTNNQTIRKITAAAVVTTLAGLALNPGIADGTGSVARFNGPRGITADGAGNIYVTDSSNHTVRKITPVGAVTTIAGTAGSNGAADGTGGAARFLYPSSIAADTSGHLYVADTLNHAIRIGMPAIADTATIDATGAAIGVARQLDTAPQTATAWSWSVRRIPSGSAALLSGTAIRNPVFTPDIADFFDFRLVATDAAGQSRISTARLDAGCPVFASSPASRDVCAGTGTTFNAPGSGNPPPAFQWSKNLSPIGGATAATYSIASVVAGDAGSYVCGATNGCGTAATTAAVLTVTAAAPAAVGNTATCGKPGASLVVKWTDIAGASSYAVFQDSTAGGTFATQIGTAASGVAGLTLAMPAGNSLFFLVAGVNSCGAGPK